MASDFQTEAASLQAVFDGDVRHSSRRPPGIGPFKSSVFQDASQAQFLHTFRSCGFSTESRLAGGDDRPCSATG